MRQSIPLALVGILFASGCPGPGTAGSSPAATGSATIGGARELNVLAAASLGEPLRKLVPAFEATRPGLRVALSLGSSSALERQIEAGAPVDLFFSAAVQPIDRLIESKLLDGTARAVVARNALVVIVPSGATPPNCLEALGGLERIAVGQRGVPVGEYAREALRTAGLGDELAGKLAGYPDEPSVVTAVAEGGAPAGIVYASSLVVHPRRDKVARALVVPTSLHAPIEYPAAIGATSAARADALAFLEHLRSAEGRACLREAGFTLDGER